MPLVGILDCGFLFGDYHAGLSMDVMDFGGFSYHWGAAGVYLDDQLWCLGMLDQFVGLASDVVVLSAGLVIVVWDDGWAFDDLMVGSCLHRMFEEFAED